MRNEQEQRGSVRQIVCFLFAVVLLVEFDQITKAIAERKLAEVPHPIISGVLELDYLRNTGAAFSLLQGKRMFFIILTVVFVIAAIAFYRKIPAGKRHRPLRICMIFLISGAIGNLIDRIRFSYVRDFISFVLIRFPIFNVADIYVTVTVVVIIALILFYYKDTDLSFLKRSEK